MWVFWSLITIVVTCVVVGTAITFFIKKSHEYFYCI